MRKIQVDDKVEVMEGANPKRIVGRVGKVIKIHYYPSSGHYEADVKFSNSYGDKYSVDVNKLRFLGSFNSYYDALLEISKEYLSDYVNSSNKHNFPKTSEEWLQSRGFYDDTCIIPYPPFVRWREMMGIPPVKVVQKFFDKEGKIIKY